jgi:hypothetical protein
MAVACGTADTPTPEALPAAPSFSSDLACPDGRDADGAQWDYGSHPRGITKDPVEWVHTNARGLDPNLTLSLIHEMSEDLDDVVIAWKDEAVLAYVDFNVDGAGRYFPVTARACRGSGIEDFA